LRACTFVEDGIVGHHRFRAGETAVLPEAFVRVLLRRGTAVETPPPPADVPPPSPLVEDRITKPAVTMSRRALKKLFGKRKV
jgi:hypothetical protein